MTPATLEAAQVTLPWGQQFELTSAITRRTYRILIWAPPGPPPPGGFPVIYVLDGDVHFPTVCAQAVQGAEWDGRPPAIVVGIGYPRGQDRTIQRQYDLAPSRPSDWSKAMGGAWIREATGEADGFHEFLVQELRSRLADYGGDPDDQTLMGFSLGGLFVLHVLFRRTTSFQTYVAGSPSIWFNHCEVLADEPAFAAAVAAGQCSPRIHLSVGAFEEDSSAPNVPREDEARVARLENMRSVRMVSNARALGERLRTLPGAAPYGAQFMLFEGETHLSVMPAWASRGLAFALGR